MKKGFTLVELLAVIAILAIILLIAIPQILGVIDAAKIDSFRNSVRGIFKAIELYTVKHENIDYASPHLISELDLSNKEFVNGIWTIQDGVIILEHVGTRQLSAPYVTSETVVKDFDVLKGSYGAGELPSVVLDLLGHPLGEQACSQSACYGYYSTDGCPLHSGTDVVSDSNAAKLYALADGEVTYINRDNTQCIPDFTTTTICGAGCTGNVITIRYSLDVGVEEPMILYSTYRHMSQFKEGIDVGSTITKGEEVGVIGTSGCSTGVHLHVELANAVGHAYNAEELLLYKGCKMQSNCPTIRAYCKY